MPKFFRSGGWIAWGLIGAVLLLMVASTALFARTALKRHERDVSRMVFNDNLQLLEDVKKSSGVLEDSVSKASETGDPASSNKPYIVVSIEDHRLWYKQGEKILFTTQVATGSGKVLEGGGGRRAWKFETPRGRLTVQARKKIRRGSHRTGISWSRRGSAGSASCGWNAVKAWPPATAARSPCAEQRW